MKNKRIMESWDKIEPSSSAHDRMLSAILEQNRLERERKGKANRMDKNKKSVWVKWGAIAACLCLVIGGLAMLSSKRPVPPVRADNPEQRGENLPMVESTEQSGDYAPMIMIDGTMYADTYEQYSGAISDAAVHHSTAYVDGRPEHDGEQNYDRENVEYMVLNQDEVVCRVDGIWRVFKRYGSTSNEDGIQSMVNDSADAPADETSYSEARAYSGDILDLQNRISAAMTNHELPFVTSSMILENPDRIHVTVTTTDEDAIALLKSFDATEKLLEIEYVTGTTAAEEAAIIDSRG